MHDAWRTPDTVWSQQLTLSTSCSGELKYDWKCYFLGKQNRLERIFFINIVHFNNIFARHLGKPYPFSYQWPHAGTSYIPLKIMVFIVYMGKKGPDQAVFSNMLLRVSFFCFHGPHQAFVHAQNVRIYMRSLIRAFSLHWNIL